LIKAGSDNLLWHS